MGVWKYIAALGAAYIEEGVRDYERWSQLMVMRYGRELEPLMRQVWIVSERIARRRSLTGGEVMKRNCWEYKRCGRELGGDNVQELGICPASVDTVFDGVHDGVSAGRACWVLAGTLCDGRVRGSFAAKQGDCRICDFHALVQEEEGDAFVPTRELLAMIERGGQDLRP